ncbi:MAG: hypothetical protein FJX03_08210 [Alphaproteobacteria bacterium]|nr:hypothetical protein [Alphaproteobacteria bacterium]
MIFIPKKTLSPQFNFLILLICFGVLTSGIKAHDVDLDGDFAESSSSQTSKSNIPNVTEKPLTVFGYEFSDTSLGRKALQPRTKAFERLEFLGDRVWGLMTAHMLYKYYPSKSIGWLADAFSKLVSKPSLVHLYEVCHIDPTLLTSPSYQAPVIGPIAEKTASDIVEALIGAVYKDRDFIAAQTYGEKLIRSRNKLNTEEAVIQLRSSLISSDNVQVSLHRRKLPQLVELLGYAFKNNRLLYDAFQHPSVGGSAFKKLDFIGVRVLALAIAEKVYNDFPDAEEGLLMAQNEQLINNDNLEGVFQKWQLWRYLTKQYHGFIGELIAPERVPNRMACGTVRTFMGAIYLDGGWEVASSAAHKLLFTDPPPDFFEPVFRLGDMFNHTSPRPSKPLVTENKDAWPSLKKEDLASHEQSSISSQSVSAISSTQSSNKQMLPAQPSYLDIAKRQQAVTSTNNDDDNLMPQDPWPELTSKKTTDASPSKRTNPQDSRKSSEIWKDPATTMKSIMPPKQDKLLLKAKY